MTFSRLLTTDDTIGYDFLEASTTDDTTGYDFLEASTTDDNRFESVELNKQHSRNFDAKLTLWLSFEI